MTSEIPGSTSRREEAGESVGTDRRPHVVQLIGQLYRGGAELQLARMLPYFDTQVWKITVVSHWTGIDPQIEENLRTAGCEIIQLDKKQHLDGGFLRRYVQTFRRLRPDVVHAWLSPGAFWIRLLRPVIRRKLPVVVSYRGWPVNHARWLYHLDRCLARKTSAFVCNSAGLQAFWQERLAGIDHEVLMIPNGVDHERFAPPTDREAVRSTLGLAGRGPIVTMVASLYPVKNWPMFVEAAARVCRELPEATFCSVGSGKCLDELRTQATDAGLSDKQIRFLGESDRVADILAASDAFLFTSNSEGTPNAILEAMATGLPIVATDIDGVRGVVTDGEDGILVPVGDAAAAAKRLLQLHRDLELRDRLGQQARERVLRSYTFANMAAMHQQLYRRAIRADARTGMTAS